MNEKTSNERVRNYSFNPGDEEDRHVRATAEALGCSVNILLRALIRAHMAPGKTAEEHAAEVSAIVKAGKRERINRARTSRNRSEMYQQALADGRVGVNKGPRRGHVGPVKVTRKPCDRCGKTVTHYAKGAHRSHLESWDCRRNVVLAKGAA